MKETEGDEFEELQIKDASKVVSNVLRDLNEKDEVDLLHVNCEVRFFGNIQPFLDYLFQGCEWEMFENLIGSGIHTKIR